MSEFDVRQELINFITQPFQSHELRLQNGCFSLFNYIGSEYVLTYFDKQNGIYLCEQLPTQVIIEFVDKILDDISIEILKR